MRVFSFVLLFFFFVGRTMAGACSLSVNEKGGVFGNDRLQILYSPQSGVFASVSVEGEPVLIAAPSPAFDFLQNEKWTLSKDVLAREPIGLTQINENTVRSRIRVGGWQVDEFAQLFPEDRMIRRWFELTWLRKTPMKLKAFWTSSGFLSCKEGKGGYLLPGYFPQVKRNVDVFRDGVRDHAWMSPHAIIGENGKGWSVLWAMNELVSYADRGSGEVFQTKEGFHVRQVIRAQGHVRCGEVQKVGDLWLYFMRGDAETMLCSMHTWMGKVGLVPPSDRPAWLKRVILYSMHPGGTTGSNCKDWGGFPASTRYLNTLRWMGCNAVWLMPLEDQSIYWPRNYYQLQDGLGGPDAYKAFTQEARRHQMRVWQDCVPHGGSNKNQRTKEHPEWLAQKEDGTTLTYWCFDFNWPSWISYMADVVRFYTKEYQLDGFRIDAVSGSKIPNWNPAIPYARASHAQSQGGLAMQRALRKAVREVRPDGANLAEAGENIHGAVSDATYDFSLCYQVLHGFLRNLPEEVVPQLRRWLHEQQYAQIKDLVRMRHQESHDSLRSGLLYGLAAQRAIQALISWIPGIPLVYQEQETGNEETFQKIFEVRSRVAELNLGDADYLSVKTPPALFACLRSSVVPTEGAAEWDEAYRWDPLCGKQATSVVLVDFSGKEGVVSVQLPRSCPKEGWARDLMSGQKVQVREGMFQLPMTAFGYTVVRFESEPLPQVSADNVPPVLTAGEEASSFQIPLGGMNLEAFLCDVDGKRLTCPYRLHWKDGVLSVQDWGGAKPEETLLAVKVPCASHWYAQSGEGEFRGPFRVRHPHYVGKVGPIYRLPQGGGDLWDSRLHPFGLGENAVIGAETTRGNVRFQMDPEQMDVRIFDKLGAATGYVAAFVLGKGEKPGGLNVRISLGETMAKVGCGTGDARLRVIPGGWVFEEAGVRLQIQRNGALQQMWKKTGSGWEKVAQSSFLYSDIGFGDKRYDQASDVETFVRMRKETDGRIRLTFEGAMRNEYRFSKMRHPVSFRTEYLLGGGRTFRMGISLHAAAAPENGNGFLAFRSLLPDLKKAVFVGEDGVLHEAERSAKGRYLQMQRPIREIRLLGSSGEKLLRMTEMRWTGARPKNVFCDGGNFFFAWMDCRNGAVPPGIWHGVEATICVGED